MTENLQNLNAERSEIAAQLDAKPTPTPDARRLVDEADRVIAEEEARLAKLKERRNAIDQAFRVKAVEQQQAREREREEQHAATVAALHAAEEQRLEAVARFEEAANLLADAINDVNSAADDVRGHARDLVRMAGGERVSLLGLSQNDLTQRTAARLAAVMALRVKGASHRLGGLEWGQTSWTLETAPGWMERERRHFAPDIAKLIGGN